MSVIVRLVFVLMLVIAPVVIYSTSSMMPPRIATHFGRGGLANGWMSHDVYIVFMVSMSTLFPLVIAATTGLLPAGARLMLRKYANALAPQGLQDALRWIAGAAAIVGVLISAFIVALHFLVLEANERTPARLDESMLVVLVVGFVVLLAIWIVTLAVRLARLR
jgi:uncharacterized membrane protein